MALNLLQQLQSSLQAMVDKAAAAKAAAAAAAAKKQANIDALTQQILGQNTSSKWTGEGFGSAQANANFMAKLLDNAGITNINQFGQTPVYTPVETIGYTLNGTPVHKLSNSTDNTDWYYSNRDGDWVNINPKEAANIKPVYGETAETESGTVAAPLPDQSKVTMVNGVPSIQSGTNYINKVTGQVVGKDDLDWSGQNLWAGTYAGEGKTGYGVQFDAQGNPYFYTQYGGDTSDIGQIAPLLSMASLIPGVAPFAMGANALLAASQGNTLGALASVAGIPGVSDLAPAGLSGITSGLQTANQAVNLANAIQSGNVLGALASGTALTGTGSTQLGTTGLTVSDAIKGANVAKAVSSGDPSAITKAISLLSSPTVQNALGNAQTVQTPEQAAAGAQKLQDTLSQYAAAPTPTPTPDITAQLKDAGLTQGVQDILKTAYSTPGTQLAANNYVGDFSGLQYDPNAGAYRLEIGGTGDQSKTGTTSPSEQTVQTPEQAATASKELQAQLEPYLSQFVDQTSLDDLQGTFESQLASSDKATQAKFDSLNSDQKALAASLASSTGNLQAAIDLAAQKSQTGISELGGQLQTFQTTTNQRIQDLMGQGLTQQQAITQVNKDLAAMGTSLGGQLQTGLAGLQGKFESQLASSDKATQAKFDSLSDQQKTLAASLAASTGDLQSAIDEAAQNTSDMFSQLQDTFGGQLQDFRTTVDQRVQDLVSQGKTQQEALDQVNSELSGMQEDFASQLASNQEETKSALSGLGGQLSSAVSSLSNLLGTQQKTQTAANTALQNQLNQQSSNQSLMNLLMLAGLSDAQGAQQTQPTQTPLADVKSFEEQGFGDLFGGKLQFSDGGSVDDLIDILRG